MHSQLPLILSWFSQNVVAFLDYDMDKKVEAGRALRRSRVWPVPHNGFCQEAPCLKAGFLYFV